MEYEKQLIWIIPNNEYSENNLEDGRGTFFPFMTGDRDHRSRCQEFCEEHKLSNYPVGGSHDDWGKYLTERGFIVFFNSGVTIDNKYFGALYLPAQLTEKQINFLEDRKELLEEKYKDYHYDILSYIPGRLAVKGYEIVNANYFALKKY